MEAQIKKAVRAGNSSAVILPRAWLNKEVRVELAKKSHETILLEAINIIKKYIALKDVVGIYLTGSYARGEEDENSDIDIFILVNDAQSRERLEPFLETLSNICFDTYGNRLAPYILTEYEMRQKNSLKIISEIANGIQIIPKRKA